MFGFVGGRHASVLDQVLLDVVKVERPGVGRVIAQNYFTQEVDPRSSEGKSVLIAFDIQRDGTPTNLRVETRSGSPSLDNAALRAIQRIDTFGDLPEGDHITIEYKFDYRP